MWTRHFNFVPKGLLEGRSLRFLIIGRVRPDTPVDVLSKLLLAQMSYLDRMREEGKIKELYHLIGKQGIAMICDVGSDEELSRLVSKDPLFFHMERQIYPVITPEAHRGLVKELLGK